MPSLRQPAGLLAAGACAAALCLATAVPAMAVPAEDNPGANQGNSAEAQTNAPGQVKQQPVVVVEPAPLVAAVPSGGANQPGPFDSNSDGSPSQNGNGGGQAVGKPCAGCVGNADDKNPPGQVKNGKDKGYECDDNNGVGKGNPAHSPCAPPRQPPPPGGEEPPGKQPPGTPGTPGKPGSETPGSKVAPAAQKSADKDDDSALAFTGAGVILPGLAGLALVGVGGTAVLATRRRRTS